MPTTSVPTPSLLLTKRLTAFLRSNLGAHIHTAALTTPSGKLLAHASPHPVAALRTQCTVAASIWALYATAEASTAVAEALPPPPAEPSSPPAPSAVVVQLAGGVVVVRRLRCRLLFVCVGPSAAADLGASTATLPPQPQPQHQLARPVPQPPASDPHHHHHHHHHPISPPLGSPSEVESVASAGAATTASVATSASVAASAAVATRRQAEELARWLDDRLGSLGALEDGLGIEPR
ncbi:hypothetical protein GGS23DRAFT_617288 [Durotheca rogersii]|uniref:uncharacterized protein n=1 Tax=Durotheca rogersii TaxID=419775 RepID=UPI002220EC61|nr:uncharacterized protein GGS23DRAFT_617288 [Durotheca rogersii]KAI5866205.1 hypothetical protein GGS23DRAFT_617288 [Durotheca rogersii]